MTRCYRGKSLRSEGEARAERHYNNMRSRRRSKRERGTSGAKYERDKVSRCEGSYSTNVPSIKIKKLFLIRALKQKEDMQEVNRPRGYGWG